MTTDERSHEVGKILDRLDKITDELVEIRISAQKLLELESQGDRTNKDPTGVGSD